MDEHAKSSSGLNPREWNALIGIITAIVGNVLISFALNIQRYAHIRLHKDHLRRKQSWRKSKSRRKVADIPNYGTQLDLAEERATANREAPQLDEDDQEHRDRYHGAADDETADERAPLKGPSTIRSSSSSTVRPRKNDEQDDGEKTSYLRSPYWWLGIVLMTIGEAGNFIAYGFAPASIVSPLGVVALVSNCIIAPLLLKEHFRQRDFWGVLVAIAGAVTIVLSARMTDPKLGPQDIWKFITRWEFETYLGITAGLIVILMWASGRYGDKSIMIDIGLVGLFGGYTALSTKGVASLLTDTIWRAITFPIFYLLVFVLVVTAICQIRYVNRALARFDSTRVVPTQFVSFTLSVIIGSAILYREFESTTAEQAGKFVGGCVLTFTGVYLITSGKRDSGIEEDFEEDATGNVEGIHMVDEEQEPAGLDKFEGRPINGSTRRVSVRDEDRTPRNSPPMSEHQTGAPYTPERTLSATSDVSLPYSTGSGISPFSENPWSESTRPQPNLNLPEASASAPLLPVEARASRPSTPSPTPNQSSNTPLKHTSSISRNSFTRLLPGPISSPLSSSLSAIVADQIRRGVDVSPRKRGSLRRMRSNVLDAEDTTSPSSPLRKGRTRSVSGTLNGLFNLNRSKSDKTDVEAARGYTEDGQQWSQGSQRQVSRDT